MPILLLSFCLVLRVRITKLHCYCKHHRLGLRYNYCYGAMARSIILDLLCCNAHARAPAGRRNNYREMPHCSRRGLWLRCAWLAALFLATVGHEDYHKPGDEYGSGSGGFQFPSESRVHTTLVNLPPHNFLLLYTCIYSLHKNWTDSE